MVRDARAMTLPAIRHMLALPGAMLLALAFVLPIAVIAWLSLFEPAFTLDHFRQFLGSSAYMAVYVNTLSVSAVVTLACLLLGYPFASGIIFLGGRRRVIWLFLVLVPLWISVLVRSYAWMVVLGREGIVNRLLMAAGLTDEPVGLLFSSGAVMLAMTQILLPFMIVTCYSAMTEVDMTLVRAARLLGASPAKAFFGVFVPLSLHGALNGAALVFVMALGFFVTPALLGGRRDAMIANVISAQIVQAEWSFAAAIAIVLFATALAILGACRVVARRFVRSGAT